MSSTIGFIMTRCVHELTNDLYWRNCYTMIRRVYPQNTIVIIDDHSTVPIDESFVNEFTIIERSDVVKGCGELLPFLYLHKKRYFDKCFIVHDSVLFHRLVDCDDVQTVKFLWDFGEEESHYIEHTHMLLSLLNVDTSLYEKKQWKGCFGTMCVITLGFLDTLMSKYPLFIIAPFVTTRLHRMCLERVFAILCYELLGCVDTLYGDIVQNVPYGTTLNQYIQGWCYYQKHFPIMKIWVSR